MAAGFPTRAAMRRMDGIRLSRSLVDFIDNGEIRDDDVFDKFFKPMKGGIAVLCIVDARHSGSVLDLPRTFTSERDLESPALEASARLISGCADTQGRTKAERGFLQKHERLDAPNLGAERVGGVVTASLIDASCSSDGRSFVEALESASWLWALDNDPQLSSSKPAGTDQPFFRLCARPKKDALATSS